MAMMSGRSPWSGQVLPMAPSASSRPAATAALGSGPIDGTADGWRGVREPRAGLPGDVRPPGAAANHPGARVEPARRRCCVPHRNRHDAEGPPGVTAPSCPANRGRAAGRNDRARWAALNGSTPLPIPGNDGGSRPSWGRRDLTPVVPRRTERGGSCGGRRGFAYFSPRGVWVSGVRSLISHLSPLRRIDVLAVPARARTR